MKRLRWKMTAATITGLLLFVGCSGSDDDSEGADIGAPGAVVDEAADSDGSFKRVAQGDGGSGGGQTTATSGGLGYDEETLESSAAPVGPHIVKTADLRVRVSDDGLQEALDSATSLAARSGGFVVSSTVDDRDQGHAQLVLRVPAEDFEQTLAALGDLGELQRKSVSGEDVSQEFIDLQARLRNAGAQEVVLLKLMNRAQTVAATIRVQHALQQVQLEMEQLKGRIRYLEDRTSLSTIAINFVERGVPVPSEPTTLTRAWETARDTFTAVVGGIVIGAAFLAPISLIGAVLAIAVMMLMKRLRPRLDATFEKP